MWECYDGFSPSSARHSPVVLDTCQRVLPRGYESQFAILETEILKGARRALKRTPGSDNFTAAVWLHQRNLQSQRKEQSKRLAVDQFLLAAVDRPSKFRARWQEKYYDGPNARRDAEDGLRAKWLQELEALLMDTKTTHPFERP